MKDSVSHRQAGKPGMEEELRAQVAKQGLTITMPTTSSSGGGANFQSNSQYWWTKRLDKNV